MISLGAIGLVIGFFVPYPTRVFPPLNLQVVDQSGRVPEHLPAAIWRGVTNVEYLEEKVPFDNVGMIHLSERIVWASPFDRFRALVRATVPHSGGVSGTWADVSFEVPKDYTLDPKATGITGTANLPGGPDGLYLVPSSGWGDHINLSIQEPGRGGSRSYRVVLKPKPPIGSS
jgi:hypothetical protein